MRERESWGGERGDRGAVRTSPTPVRQLIGVQGLSVNVSCRVGMSVRVLAPLPLHHRHHQQMDAQSPIPVQMKTDPVEVVEH